MPRVKNGQNVKCEVCNKESYFSPSRLKKNKHRTCSKRCLGLLFKGKCKTKIVSECPICKTIIAVKPFHRKRFKGTLTCSRTCRSEFLKQEYLGESNPNHRYKNEVQKFLARKISQLNNVRKNRILEITVTPDELYDIYKQQQGLCYYTKIPMKMATTENYQDRNQPDLDVISVDRINSNLGYTKENIVLCCNSINKMKGNTPQLVFLEFFKAVLENAK